MRGLRRAEAVLEFAALCVVGTISRQMRQKGDNHGVHPTRLVVTTADPYGAAETYNRGVHSVGAIYHTLAYVYWPSRDHGERARDWIEEQVRGERLLHGWYDVEPWQWEIMFGEAARALSVAAFDERERSMRVAARLARG